MSEKKNDTDEKTTPLDHSQPGTEQFYYLLDFLSKNSFYNRPLSITNLISNLDQCTDSLAKFLLNHPDPSMARVGPLMQTADPTAAAARKVMERKLRDLGKITCADGANAYDVKDLMSFQIVRRFKKENQLVTMDLGNSPPKKNKSKTLVHLTYRYNPYTLKLADQDEPFDFSSEDYLHQISARWQYTLDAICGFPHISKQDAGALHKVLRRLHTLGEIPERIDLGAQNNDDSDQECIDFNILSKILRYLHAAYKYQSICTGNPHLSKVKLLQGNHDVIKKEKPVIPLMAFTMGAYSPRDGKPILEKMGGKIVQAYPVSTRVWNGKYYLAVRYPNKKDEPPQYGYLRCDHILDCKSLAKNGTIPYDLLGTPPDIEQEMYGRVKCSYDVTHCPEETLIDIIDTFGKSCICAANRENDLWSFRITIPKSRKRLLSFLHSAEYITPTETQKQIDSTGADFSEYLSKLIALNKYIMEELHPARVPLPQNITSDYGELVQAIRENNTDEIDRLLNNWTSSIPAEDAAWLCYIALPLNSAQYQRILNLGPQFGPISVSLSFKDTDDSVISRTQSIATAAAQYDYAKSLELLLALDPPSQEMITVAILEGSTNCLNYLLTYYRDHFFKRNKEGKQTLTGEILVALAHAGGTRKSMPDVNSLLKHCLIASL